ncbi:MAG: hypothetical protein K8H87_04255 [Pseudorhodoplanes sp.]|nr:hypothetical protein [Pseudorhodoplanes sp.]
MSIDRQSLHAEAAACLGQNKPAGELVDCVARSFPDLDVFRENDDLIIRGGTRFLLVRRAGPDRFRVTENVAVPSTNMIDSGGGAERSLKELIDEISAIGQ